MQNVCTYLPSFCNWEGRTVPELSLMPFVCSRRTLMDYSDWYTMHPESWRKEGESQHHTKLEQHLTSFRSQDGYVRMQLLSSFIFPESRPSSLPPAIPDSCLFFWNGWRILYITFPQVRGLCICQGWKDTLPNKEECTHSFMQIA